MPDLRPFLAAVAAIAAAPAGAQSLDNPTWMEPVTPFRIADRLYYVGSRDLAALLIDSGDGLILLDAGLPDFAPRLLANIRTLGFDPRDIRILLTSHAHFDHAGGLAAVQAASGARMFASHADAPLLARGGKDDFQWDDRFPYPPVRVDRRLKDGEKVTLGRVTLTAHLTPGHTKGCTTWTFPVTDRGRTYAAQYNCSTTVPGYRLLGNARYPAIADDYRRTFAKVRRLPCDIFLAGHGSFFDLDAKRAKLVGPVNPFVDPGGCKRYLDRTEAAFRSSLRASRPKRGVRLPSRCIARIIQF